MGERRVGTFTFGISLVVFGIMFLIRTIFVDFDYTFIFHLWPVMFILLGLEVLYYSIRYKDIHFKYDVGAFFLLGIIIIFAMGMAGIEFLMDNYELYC